MLDDTNVISAPAGRYSVQGQRFEILFKDGSTIGLHPVLVDGVQHMFLRALRQGSCSLVVFDLRDVCKELDIEIRQTHARDVPGLVFYTLRKHFCSAPACSASMMALPIDMLTDVTVAAREALAA